MLARDVLDRAGAAHRYADALAATLTLDEVDQALIARRHAGLMMNTGDIANAFRPDGQLGCGGTSQRILFMAPG